MPMPLDDPKNVTIKEPYEPPMVEDVPIRAEEQLLANCKTPAGGGADPFVCALCSAPTAS